MNPLSWFGHESMLSAFIRIKLNISLIFCSNVSFLFEKINDALECYVSDNVFVRLIAFQATLFGTDQIKQCFKHLLCQ